MEADLSSSRETDLLTSAKVFYLPMTIGNRQNAKYLMPPLQTKVTALDGSCYQPSLEIVPGGDKDHVLQTIAITVPVVPIGTIVPVRIIFVGGSHNQRYFNSAYLTPAGNLRCCRNIYSVSRNSQGNSFFIKIDEIKSVNIFNYRIAGSV